MMTVGVSGWQVDKAQSLSCAKMCAYVQTVPHGRWIQLLLMTWAVLGVNKDLPPLLGSHKVTALQPPD